MKLQDSTESMPKNGGITKLDREIAEFLRLSGRKIPASLAAKSRAAMKSLLLRKRNAEIEQRIQGAKLNGKAPIAVDDPANREVLDAILRLHKSAARTKVLPFPEVAPALGGVSSVFSGTAVPPFDFAYKTPLAFSVVTPLEGDPTMSGTASHNGQISASVVTSEIPALYSAGREHATVGIYFRPVGPGRLTISSSPTFSFGWTISSLNSEGIFFAVGSICLDICGVNGEGESVDVEDRQSIYLESASGNNNEFGAQRSLSASLQVIPSMIYSCYVYLDVGAFAVWPDGLAMSMMSATVPSISYEFAGKFPLKP